MGPVREIVSIFALIVLAANLAITKWCQKTWKMTKTLAYGYSSESTPWDPPILRLLSSKAHRHKDFWKLSKPCHVGIHWIALLEYSQMSTHMPGFQSFFRFLGIFFSTNHRPGKRFSQYYMILLRNLNWDGLVANYCKILYQYVHFLFILDDTIVYPVLCCKLLYWAGAIYWPWT